MVSSIYCDPYLPSADRLGDKTHQRGLFVVDAGWGFDPLAFLSQPFASSESGVCVSGMAWSSVLR